MHGDVMGAADLPTRLHSECLTGDVMGSLRCDCRDQLETALRKLGSMERGLLLVPPPRGAGHWPGQQDPRVCAAGKRGSIPCRRTARSGFETTSEITPSQRTC